MVAAGGGVPLLLAALIALSTSAGAWGPAPEGYRCPTAADFHGSEAAAAKAAAHRLTAAEFAASGNCDSVRIGVDYLVDKWLRPWRSMRTLDEQAAARKVGMPPQPPAAFLLLHRPPPFPTVWGGGLEQPKMTPKNPKGGV
jgi:hypothetical protein